MLIARAFVGGLIAGLTSAGASLQAGNGFGWVVIIAALIAGLTTFSGVAFLPIGTSGNSK